MDEIEELKSAIYADPGQVDPAQEFQRRLQEREKEFLPDPQAVRAGSAAQPGPAPQPAPVRARSPVTLDAEESPSPDRGGTDINLATCVFYFFCRSITHGQLRYREFPSWGRAHSRA